MKDLSNRTLPQGKEQGLQIKTEFTGSSQIINPNF
jgi:hypothetical protein